MAIEFLTPREFEVLRLASAAYSNREIAGILVVSVRTVDSHTAHILARLNVHSRGEAIRVYLAKYG